MSVVSIGWGSAPSGSAGFDSYLYLESCKRRIKMAMGARSLLDMSTTTFMASLSDWEMFRVSWVILTVSKTPIHHYNKTHSKPQSWMQYRWISVWAFTEPRHSGERAIETGRSSSAKSQKAFAFRALIHHFLRSYRGSLGFNWRTSCLSDDQKSILLIF